MTHPTKGQQRPSDQLSRPMFRSLALLACGGVLFDRDAGYLTIEGPDGGVWWSGHDLGQLKTSAYLDRGQIRVLGAFSSETPYRLNEHGRQALQATHPDWQSVLERQVRRRPEPGDSHVVEITLADIICMWMDSPYFDRNTYLYIRYQWEDTVYRGIALKKDNKTLFREGLFPNTATNELGKRETPNPYLLLVQEQTNRVQSNEEGIAGDSTVGLKEP